MKKIYLLKYLDNEERFRVLEKTMQHRHNAVMCTYSAYGPEEWRKQRARRKE